MNYLDFEKMNKAELIQYLQTLSRAYAPEWRFEPDSKDVGSALAMIYADLLHECIKKVSLLPQKHNIDLLNLFDPQQMPSKASEGYVVLELSEGTQSPIPLLKDHPLLGEDAEVHFETSNDVLILPSKLEAAYALSESGILNRIAIESSFKAFEVSAEQNIHENQLVIQDDRLLKMESGVAIDIEIAVEADAKKQAYYTSRLTDAHQAQWYYEGVEGTRRLTATALEDGLIRLTDSIPLCLTLPELRLVMNSPERIAVDTLKLRPVHAMISPKALYTNDDEIGELPAYPFGEHYRVYDSFYIGSDEILSKYGSRVDLKLQMVYEHLPLLFEVPDPPVRWRNVLKKSELDFPSAKAILIEHFALEYWNGMGWANVSWSSTDRELFKEKSDPFVTHTLSFICPDDIQPTAVGAHEGLWVRFRLMKIENAYTSKGFYVTPKLRGMALTYTYEKPSKTPQNLVKSAFLESETLNTKHSPLVLMDSNRDLCTDSLYLRFSNPIQGAPIRMFFNLKAEDTFKDASLLWQLGMLRGDERHWHNIENIDETKGFKHGGLITLLQKQTHAPMTLFGEEGYWVRVLPQGGRNNAQMLGIYLNAVHVIQKATQAERLFTLSAYDYGKSFDLEVENIQRIEVWVDEGADGLKLNGFKRDIQYLADGDLAHCWVLWTATTSLFALEADERCYAVDLYKGKVKFGDTVHGYLPQSNRMDNVRIRFSTNMGALGNVSELIINRMGRSIANVNRIYNPVKTFGGQVVESKASALQRTSDAIRHLDRARTYGDLDAIIAGSNFDIAEVKTLAVVSESPRRIVSYVHPKQNVGEITYFDSLRDSIMQKVLKALPCTLIYGVNFSIEMPAYVYVDVKVQGIITDMNVYLRVVRDLQNHLSDYLDTFKGNQDGKGWHFGEYPDVNVMMNRLLKIEALEHVEHIILQPKLLNQKPISNKALKQLEHFIVVNGQHDIQLSRSGY